MRIAIPFLLCLLGLAACEKSINVEVPDQAARLVMNSVVRVGEPIIVRLSRSRSIKESNQQIPDGIAGASVVLYVDGQLADTLQSFAGAATTYESKIISEPGRTYRLRVEVKGYEPIEATAVGPTKVPITSWDYKPNARQTTTGSSEDAFSIGFVDPAGGRDHYVVLFAEAYERGTEMDFYSWGGCVYSSDPSLESSSSDPFEEGVCISSNSIFLQDALFNGGEKKLSMYLSSGMLQPQEDTAGNKRYAQVYLYHVSEDFYKYLKSYREALDASGNPFAEPINVSTNVQHGYGIFAILNAHKEEIEF